MHTLRVESASCGYERLWETRCASAGFSLFLQLVLGQIPFFDSSYLNPPDRLLFSNSEAFKVTESQGVFRFQFYFLILSRALQINV